MGPKKRVYHPERRNAKKRSHDQSERNEIIEAKKACIFRRGEERHEIDKYCWICHKLGQDTNCNICMRVYHDDCLTRSSGKFTNLNVCPECQLESLDGTGVSKYLTLDKLKKLLRAVTVRAYEKKREKKEIFLRWPENLEISKLVKIIDFGILLDNINKDVHYTKTTEFYSDIKCMYHNCCIIYGANSDQARAAEQMRRHFKKELLDMESCPECYYHLYCDESNEPDPFVRLCDPPHDIVWAQLTGHPYWPAKCLKVVKGIAHVRFFGEHEISDLPLSKIFHISESHPKFKNSKITSATNSGPKSLRYKAAIMELVKYIQLYTRVYGEFPYYPHRTHYNQGKSQHEINSDEVEVVSNEENEENQLSYGTIRGIQLKLEGNIEDEDSSTVEFTEDIANQRENSEIPVNSPINSGGTSVDMTFSTEAYLVNPKVTAVSSLSTDCLSTSTTHQTPNVNAMDLDNVLQTSDLKSMKAIATGTISPVGAAALTNPDGVISSHNHENLLNPSISLVHDSSSIRSQISTVERSDEPILAGLDEAHTENSNASTEIISNPSESMEDEVVILDPPPANDSYVPRGDRFNPAYVLPFILEGEPQLKNLFQHGQFILTAFFVRLWALLQNCSSAPERLSTALTNSKKYETLYHDIESDRDHYQSLADRIQTDFDQYKKDYKIHTNELRNLAWKSKQDEQKIATILENSRLVADSLKKKVTQVDQEWTEKYNDLLIELEKAKKDRDFYKAESEKYKAELSSDKIRSYLVNDYCSICQAAANMHCCLNHNYCSSECKAYDFPQHVNFCPNVKKKLSKPDLEPTDQPSMYRKKVIQKHSKTVASIHIEVEQKSSEIITSETGELFDTSPTSEETQLESSSETDQTETQEEQIQASPSSPPPESPTQSIIASTRCYGGKRTLCGHYHQ